MTSTKTLLFIAAALISASPGMASSTKAKSDYILHCSGCHGISGKGSVAGGIPTFPDSIEHIAGYENGRDYILQVPGVITTNMDDGAVAEVLNYILDEWSDAPEVPKFTAEEVTLRRAKPERDVVVHRREIVDELSARGIEIAVYPWP